MKGRLLRQEHGFALVFALMACVVLTIAATSVVTYATANQHASTSSNANIAASDYAEGGLNAAYSIITKANSSGSNPASPTLLGCTSGAAGASNCSSPTYICFSLKTTCPGTYTPTDGTAAVYGYFSGTNSTSYLGYTVPTSTWLLVSTGYARNESGALHGKTAYGEVTVSALNGGAVASVWNHVFLTAPLVPNVCQTNFAGNNMLLDVPMYVIGNLCLTGQNGVIGETTKPIDLMVGGKLILSGSNTEVGWDSSHPITSGVVVGGCNTTAVTNATTACDSGSYRYWVGTKDTFISQDAPTLTNAQIAQDYSTFDPGPKHACLAGTTPAPLAASAFDSTVSANEGSTNPLTLPDVSGSVTSGTAFNLTPSSSYACISQNGVGTGYLIWNNNSSGNITVSGVTVAPKTLAINGSIFFDSNISITQSMYYTGTGIIEDAGSATMSGNNLFICAVTNCSFSNWQGTSGNNQMLTLASLDVKNTGIGFTMSGNGEIFQGSLWSQPTAKLAFSGNGIAVQGPISIGLLDSTVNNVLIQPLPAIKNMPVGAPLPPNTGASVSPLKVVG
jgi:Tfp pilus assembly protein PilX